MSNKNCRNCKFCTDDETLDVCPECGTELVDESGANQKDNDVADIEVVLENEDATDTSSESEEPKTGADKVIKIITASVAFVLALLIGFFTWYMFAVKKSSSLENFDINRVAGNYMAHDGWDYFKFETKEVKVELASDTGYMEDMFGGLVSLPEGMITSDATTDDGEKKYVTFDGTYESGSTEKWARDNTIAQYINNNDLAEEYSKYLKDNKLYMDDFEGFVKEKGISQSELDVINQQYGFYDQLEYRVMKGYWNYNKATGEIDLYDESGHDIITSFVVSGDAVVESASLCRGKNSGKEKYETTYTYNFDGVSVVMSFYKDGNCIIKSTYQGDTKYSAGTYLSNKDYVKIEINGQAQSYVKVKDGIALVAFIKQK